MIRTDPLLPRDMSCLSEFRLNRNITTNCQIFPEKAESDVQGDEPHYSDFKERVD